MRIASFPLDSRTRVGRGRLLQCAAIALFNLGCSTSQTGPGSSSIKTLWYAASVGVSYAQPGVDSTTAYFGTGHGEVMARDRRSGDLRWATSVAQTGVSGARILVRRGIVVVPIARSTVGLDAATGQQLWSYTAPQDTVGAGAAGSFGPGQVVQSRIDADSTTVYIPAWGASVSAVDLRTGAARWTWQPSRAPTDTASSGVFRSGAMGVAVSGDSVFVLAWHYLTRLGVPSETWLVTLDRLTGRELLRLTLPDVGSAVTVESAPAVTDRLVIIHTVAGSTYAVDRASGQIAWTFRAPSGADLSTVSGAAVAGDAVYVDGGDRHIYALSLNDGHVRWTSAFPTQATTDLLVTPTRVVFTEGRTLYVLDRLSGRQVASAVPSNTSDPLIASEGTWADGVVYINVNQGCWAFVEP